MVRGRRGAGAPTTHEFLPNGGSRCHLASVVTPFGHIIGALTTERTVGTFAPAPGISVPAVPPDREAGQRGRPELIRVAEAAIPQRVVSAGKVLLPSRVLTRSPSHECMGCRGSGCSFELDVRPSSAGIPEQTEIDDDAVALWYPDGTTGTVRTYRCPGCDGTGMRLRFGPSDVRRMDTWATRNRIEFPECTRALKRGLVINGRSAREADACTGEIFVDSDTTRRLKASTMKATC